MGSKSDIWQWVLLTIILLGCMALAGWLAVSHQARADRPVPAAQSPTRIDVDEQAHTVRIIIDGRPAVLIDRDGVTIAGDVRYGGLNIDLGPEQARARLERPSSPAGERDE